MDTALSDVKMRISKKKKNTHFWSIGIPERIKQ